jgi:hypothetical protein
LKTFELETGFSGQQNAELDESLYSSPFYGLFMVAGVAWMGLPMTSSAVC